MSRNKNNFGGILTQFTGLLRTNTVAAKRCLLAERTGLGKSVSVALRKKGPYGNGKGTGNLLMKIKTCRRQPRIASELEKLFARILNDLFRVFRSPENKSF